MVAALVAAQLNRAVALLQLLLRGLPAATGAALPLVPPVAVGHVRMVELPGCGRTVAMRTLALHPPIFRVEGLLNESEADAIVAAARGEPPAAWSDSRRHVPAGRGRWGPEAPGTLARAFAHADADGDGRLDAEELAAVMAEDFALVEHDHALFLRRHNLSSPLVSLGDLHAGGVDLPAYAAALAEAQPHLRKRHSRSTWLPYDRAVTRLLLPRMQSISGLPDAILDTAHGQLLQVVHYPAGGHYSCHHDSYPQEPPFRSLVRITSLAIFLSGPLEGGELAFPLADVPRDSIPGLWPDVRRRCLPGGACTRLGGVVARPRKGDAVFWYNMQPDRWSDDGRGDPPGLEAFLEASLHCGAEVTRGEKWMANLWLRSLPWRPAASGQEL